MRSFTTFRPRTQPVFAGESRTNRSVLRALLCQPMTQDNGSGQVGDFFWGALAARVLHPTHVEIIESLRWIDQPLSATDLLRIFESQRVGLRIERRLRQLARLDAVALAGNENARAPMGQRCYRLVKQTKL